MKRLHIHTNILSDNFETTRIFYENLFGVAPTTAEDHYVKWLIDDPRVNFVLEKTEGPDAKEGIHHVGLQVETDSELSDLKETFKAKDIPILDIGETVCCYAKSNKAWTMDPTGLRWEMFHTHGSVSEYGAKTAEEQALY